MGGAKKQIPHPGGPRGFQNFKSPTPGAPGFSKFKSPTPGYMGDFKINIKYNNLKYFLANLYSGNTVDIPQ